MSQFIGASMPAAYAGDLTRGFFDHTCETKANDKTTPVTAFGVPVKFNSGKTAVTPITAGSDAVIGIAVRKYGQADSSGVQHNTFVTVLKRGYIAIPAPTGETITAGAAVYLKSDGSYTASATSTTLLANAQFTGAVVNGVAEIAYNI